MLGKAHWYFLLFTKGGFPPKKLHLVQFLLSATLFLAIARQPKKIGLSFLCLNPTPPAVCNPNYWGIACNPNYRGGKLKMNSWVAIKIISNSRACHGVPTPDVGQLPHGYVRSVPLPRPRTDHVHRRTDQSTTRQCRTHTNDQKLPSQFI